MQFHLKSLHRPSYCLVRFIISPSGLAGFLIRYRIQLYKMIYILRITNAKNTEGGIGNKSHQPIRTF
jgi:hypothetical protein